MKRIFGLILIQLTLSSCSHLMAIREESEMKSQQTSGKDEMVSKAQYEELARKYQDLLQKSKQLPSEKVAASENSIESVTTLPSNINDGAVKPNLGAETTTIDPAELVNKLDTTLPDLKNETAPIDAAPVAATAQNVQEVMYTDDVDEQIKQMREAANLIRVNKFEQALSILKMLETSKEKQVQVRAKMMLGDLLFNQGEFDLAMQVYEEVLSKHAFSGLVIKALGKLVACAEKLKQPEKQAKYYSFLHDFFEAG